MLDSYPKKIELTLLADYLSVLGKNISWFKILKSSKDRK